MEREKFNWSDDTDIVVRSYGSIAVYQNPSGDIVIRQEDCYQRDEDSMVIVSAHHARAIAKAILGTLKKTEA